MKPLRTFIFFVTVALLLFLLALIFPHEGISVGSSVHFKFMNLSDLSHSRLDRDEVVKELLTASTVSEDPEADFELPVIESPIKEEPVEKLAVTTLSIKELHGKDLPRRESSPGKIIPKPPVGRPCQSRQHEAVGLPDRVCRGQGRICWIPSF